MRPRIRPARQLASRVVGLTTRPAVQAHGGGLDANGCHNDRKNGGYRHAPAACIRPAVGLFAAEGTNRDREPAMNFGSSGGGLTRSEASAEWPAAFSTAESEEGGCTRRFEGPPRTRRTTPQKRRSVDERRAASSAVWGRSFLFEHRLRAGPDSNRSRQRSDLFGSSGLPGTTLTLPGRRLTIG